MKNANGMNDRLSRRLEWRRSNACAPRRNRYRESKTGQAPWDADDWRDMAVSEDFDDTECPLEQVEYGK